MPDQETQPAERPSDLASFGEELKREREIRGISLKEIADATKISKRFLEAIERNDHKTLPAPVFTRGFVREYARYLGLSSEDMVNRYNYAAAADERIEKPHAHPVTSPPPRDIAPRLQPKRGIPHARVDRNILLLILIAAAFAGVAYWAVSQKKLSAFSNSTETDTAPPPVVTAPVPVAPVTQTAKPVDDSSLRLVVEALEPSWVELEADGKVVVNETLERGARRSFEAKDAFRFRKIGNAAGLKLTFNETEVPPLGETGEVIRNRIFDREALGTLRAAPPRSET
ncbi:MAG TPA: helix-turn-helix domain-containing protein [Thermoanaerobaculia bacterium]|jgi:transcriptional regulator with XRE-family HTH domain